MSNIRKQLVEEDPMSADWSNPNQDSVVHNVDTLDNEIALGYMHRDVGRKSAAEEALVFGRTTVRLVKPEVPGEAVARTHYIKKEMLPIVAPTTLGLAGAYEGDSVSFLPSPKSPEQILKTLQGVGKAALGYRPGMRQKADDAIAKYAPASVNYIYGHLQDPEMCKEVAMKSTILKGITAAHKKGFVSDEELDAALSHVAPKDLKVYSATQLAYVATSIVGNIATPPLMVTAGSAKELLAIYAAGSVATGGIRSLITKIIGHKTNSDLKTAIKYAAIPQAGLYLAVPKQIQDSYGGEQSDIAHYNRRWLYGKIGYAYFGKGGMGSKGEEKVTACVDKGKEYKTKMLGLAVQYSVYRSTGINMRGKG